MKRTAWIATAACMAVWALVGTGIYRGRLREATPPPDMATATALPLWRLTPGQALRYDLDYRGSLGSELTSLSGRLQVQVLQATSGGYLAWLDLTVDPPPSVQALARLVPQLKAGTYIVLRERGFGLALASPDEVAAAGLAAQDLEPAARAFWQSLSSRLQVATAPSGARQEEFERAQIDAVSNWGEGSGPEALTWTKHWSTPAGAARPLNGSATARFRPAFQGLAELHWQGDELLSAGREQLTARSELQLRWQGEAPFALGPLRERLARRSVNQAPVAAAKVNQIDAAVVANLDEGQLLALLRQHGGSSELPQELYLQLKSWLALHPESIAPLQALALEWGPGDPRCRGLIKALATVGSDEAQGALVGMSKAFDGQSEAQARTLTSLGLVAHPNAATAAAMLAFAEQGKDPAVARRAQLATGIVGSRLRQSGQRGDAEQARLLEQHLDSWLKEATTEAALGQALGALGNLGPSDTSAVRELQHHASPRIRGQAYFALRFSPDAGVSQQLAQGYLAEQGEGSAQVKAEIIRALALRRPDPAWRAAVELLQQHGLTAADASALTAAAATKRF